MFRLFPAEGAASVTRAPRRFPTLAALLFVLGAIACSDRAAITSPALTRPAVGFLTGTVTLLGNDGPRQPAGNVTLYASEQELDSRTARYGAVLNPRSGVDRSYNFFVGGIAPGDYYVRFCWSIGCGEYRSPATGALRTVRIVPGRTTRLSFGL